MKADGKVSKENNYSSYQQCLELMALPVPTSSCFKWVPVVLSGTLESVSRTDD